MMRNDGRSSRHSRHRSALGICAAGLLLTLLILLIVCFTAFTLGGANEDLSAAKKNAALCRQQCRAETTAAEIICEFSQRDGSISSKNGRYGYDADQGTIEVTCIDGNVFFTVPISEKKGLYVDVQVTKDDLTINEWNIVDDIS